MKDRYGRPGGRPNEDPDGFDDSVAAQVAKFILGGSGEARDGGGLVERFKRGFIDAVTNESVVAGARHEATRDDPHGRTWTNLTRWGLYTTPGGVLAVEYLEGHAEGRDVERLASIKLLSLPGDGGSKALGGRGLWLSITGGTAGEKPDIHLHYVDSREIDKESVYAGFGPDVENAFGLRDIPMGRPRPNDRPACLARIVDALENAESDPDAIANAGVMLARRDGAFDLPVSRQHVQPSALMDNVHEALVALSKPAGV